MKVIGWIHYDWIEEFKLMEPHNSPGLVLEFTEKKFLSMKQDILDNKLTISGHDHQHEPFGVPVWEDGTFYTFSQREWGSLMAEIFEPNVKWDFKYVKYYLGNEKERWHARLDQKLQILLQMSKSSREC